MDPQLSGVATRTGVVHPETQVCAERNPMRYEVKESSGHEEFSSQHLDLYGNSWVTVVRHSQDIYDDAGRYDNAGRTTYPTSMFNDSGISPKRTNLLNLAGIFSSSNTCAFL